MLLIGQILKQHTQKLKKCAKHAKDVDNSLYTFIARKTPGARKTLLAIFSSKVDKTSNKSNQDNKGDKNIFAWCKKLKKKEKYIFTEKRESITILSLPENFIY